MKIGLHDAERDYLKNKSFPNYALMKISAWHKAHGDYVEWWNPLVRYDRVYSSKVFDFTPMDVYLPEETIRGGYRIYGYSDGSGAAGGDRWDVPGLLYISGMRSCHRVSYKGMPESLPLVRGSPERGKYKTLQDMERACEGRYRQTGAS